MPDTKQQQQREAAARLARLARTRDAAQRRHRASDGRYPSKGELEALDAEIAEARTEAGELAALVEGQPSYAGEPGGTGAAA